MREKLLEEKKRAFESAVMTWLMRWRRGEKQMRLQFVKKEDCNRAGSYAERYFSAGWEHARDALMIYPQIAEVIDGKTASLQAGLKEYWNREKRHFCDAQVLEWHYGICEHWFDIGFSELIKTVLDFRREQEKREQNSFHLLTDDQLRVLYTSISDELIRRTQEFYGDKK